jgi:hypothetical protein
MAQQTDIDAVKVQLPDPTILATFNIDDTAIGLLLDSGNTRSQTILAVWRAIAGKTATYTDISESGSSRNMTALNANAREMCSLWQAQVDKEMNSAGTELIRRFVSHPATRV